MESEERLSILNSLAEMKPTPHLHPEVSLAHHRARPLGAPRSRPYNPRKISEQQLDTLARSMREFGVVDPVIADDGCASNGYERQAIRAGSRGGTRR